MLPDATNLALFVTAALVMLLTPGPAVTFIIARSIEQGRAAGLLTVLGIQSGVLVHIVAATLGLSSLLLSSALAFNVVKYAGAAYLIYLGVRTFMQPAEPPAEGVPVIENRWRIFRDGFVVCLLNPKTALFFFAFLPQFVNVQRGSVAGQIFVLGIIFLVMATITDGLYALAAGSAGQWLRTHRGFLRAQRYVTGSVYIGLGLATALADARRTK